MEHDVLVQEILRRVAGYLDAPAPETPVSPVDSTGPGLLVLSPDHGQLCHTLLDHPTLNHHFSLTCALAENYDVALEDFQAVVLLGFSVQILGELSSGCCTTPFTRLAQQVLLMGKTLLVPQEEVELYRYHATASPAYYDMLKGKLDFLQDCGMVLCPFSQLEERLLGEKPAAEPPQETPAPVPSHCADETPAHIGKRVITERDMVDAIDGHVSTVTIGKKAILTDLAADYAKSHRVAIQRI